MRTPLFQKMNLSPEQVRAGLDLLSRPRTIRKRGKTIEKDPIVVQTEGRIALGAIAAAERSLAQNLKRLRWADHRELRVPSDVFGTLTPDESQQAAVQLAAQSGVLVLTGGPGVGKTTVAKAMLALYDAAGLSVVCCAPTGKAAIRMAEQTGRPASTIHQLLKYAPGATPFYHAENKLDAQVVVVDEASMIAVDLFDKLVCAIRKGARLLIIGDVDQLPSIGEGRVLFDLITAGAIPTVRLTQIHRQASESRIPYVARDINEGRCFDTELRGTDVSHWETNETHGDNGVLERVLGAVLYQIPERKGIAKEDVQVLASQYEDENGVGVVAINRLLQQHLNPSADARGDVFVGRKYVARTHDKVIQTKNVYDLGRPVMNGEIGRVVASSSKSVEFDPRSYWTDRDKKGETAKSIEGFVRQYEAARHDAMMLKDLARTYGGLTVAVIDGEPQLVWTVPRVLVVDFGDARIAYTKEEARAIELAYCITVHKSQGSQFPAVIVVTHPRHNFMLTRPLLYTAVTRAEKFVLTIGTAQQIGRSAANTRGVERRTWLQQYLQEAK